jgi:hypothetical protein
MEGRRCLGIDRLWIEKLFYGDICGPDSSTEQPFNAPSQTGRPRSLCSCEIYGTSTRRTQRSREPSTIVSSWTVWQSQRYREYVHENVRCPSCNRVSQHVVHSPSSKSSKQGSSACRCRGAHPHDCNVHLVTAFATRTAEQFLYFQTK